MTNEQCRSSNNELPLVSIITATRNAEDYLDQSIQSVINQSYPNIEYIIIDGLSDDGTTEIIKKYSAHIDYWCSEPDNSMYDAINKGINKSHGDIIAVLNADDRYFDNDVVSGIVDFLKENDVGGVYGDLIVDYGSLIRYKKVFQIEYDEYLLSGKGTFIPHITLFIKKSCLDRIGLYNENYKYASDYDFILRCLKLCTLKYIPVPIAIFRRHDGSITASGKIRNERIKVLQSYGYMDYPLIRRRMTSIRLWAKYYFMNMKKRIQLR